MRIRLFLIVVMSMAATSCGQSLHLRNCHQPSILKEFKPEKHLLGKWLEIERSFNLLEVNLRCVTVELFKNDDGDIAVISKGVLSNSNKTVEISEGILSKPDPDIPGKFRGTLAGTPFPVNYWIVDTDFRNYIVIWACWEAFGLMSTENLWILSHKTSMDPLTRRKIYKKLDSIGIDRKGLYESAHFRCLTNGTEVS